MREASQNLEEMSQGFMPAPLKDHGKGVFQYEDLTPFAGRSSAMPVPPDEIVTSQAPRPLEQLESQD